MGSVAQLPIPFFCWSRKAGRGAGGDPNRSVVIGHGRFNFILEFTGMKTKRRKRAPQRRSVEVLHFVTRVDPLPDLETVNRCIMTVGTQDREWISEHPRAPFRRRPISEAEVRATGIPPRSEVLVVPYPDGWMLLKYFTPEDLALKGGAVTPEDLPSCTIVAG